jgi:hypothetical protein
MLIGLIGHKSAGKDTFADVLVHEYGFTKRAFADPLKKCCQSLFFLSESQLSDPIQKEKVDPRWGLSPRQIFQKVGTDLFRHHFDTNFWVKHFLLGHDKTRSTVCSDVRFENEAETIRRLGGILIRIHRDSKDNDSHESELLPATIFSDYDIYNKGTLTDYINHIHLFCDTVLKVQKKRL